MSSQSTAKRSSVFSLTKCKLLVGVVCLSTISAAMSAELKQSERFATSLSKGGKVGFVGIALKGSKIVAVVANSPAANAKLARGDRIISVDGVAVANINEDELMRRIRGPVNTIVNLTIERGGKQYSCKVKRGEVDFSDDPQIPKFVPSNTVVTTEPLGPECNKQAAGGARTVAQNRPVLDSVDSTMISILRRTSETDAVHDQVLKALKAIPLPLRQKLIYWGLKIEITPTLLESNPQFANEKPRGYTHGGGYDNCSGLYQTKENKIYIAERSSMFNSPFKPSTEIAGTVLHEVGHAFDRMERLSNSEEFTASYQDDCSRFTNEVRREFEYFTQEGQAGPSELFAELFAAGIAPPGAELTSNDLPRAFPRCFQFVRTQTVK